jgi:hypothetical protein
MAKRHAKGGAHEPEMVRKSLMVDPNKLEQARKALGVSSDAEALRQALDHLLEHLPARHGEEE